MRKTGRITGQYCRMTTNTKAPSERVGETMLSFSGVTAMVKGIYKGIPCEAQVVNCCNMQGLAEGRYPGEDAEFKWISTYIRWHLGVLTTEPAKEKVDDNTLQIRALYIANTQ